MAISTLPNIQRTPSTPNPQNDSEKASHPATTNDNDDFNADGYPVKLTDEHKKWLNAFNDDYMALDHKKKNPDKRKWLKGRNDEFREMFPDSLIENSVATTKDVRFSLLFTSLTKLTSQQRVNRHFYNYYKKCMERMLRDQQGVLTGRVAPTIGNTPTIVGTAPHAGTVDHSSLFVFERKPEMTTARALFAKDNKDQILELVAARRIHLKLDTKSNLPLYNEIRGEEYNKLSAEEKRAWEMYAETENELALAAWEKPADDDVVLRYV